MTTAAQRMLIAYPVPSTSATKIITVPAVGAAYYISLITATNIHASAGYWLKVWEVPNSGGAEGTPSDSNLLIPGSAIPATEIVVFSFGAPGIKLPFENDTVWVQAEAAGQIILRMYGFTA